MHVSLHDTFFDHRSQSGLAWGVGVFAGALIARGLDGQLTTCLPPSGDSVRALLIVCILLAPLSQLNAGWGPLSTQRAAVGPRL